MPEKTAQGWNCTVSEMAEITGLTRKTIHDAIAAGCPVVKQGKGGKGNPTIIRFYDCLQWRDAKRPSKDVERNQTKERLDAIRIARAELDLAERIGDLVHFSELLPYIRDKLVICRQLLCEIPKEMRERFGGEAGSYCDMRITQTLNTLGSGTGLGGIEEHARGITKSR